MNSPLTPIVKKKSVIISGVSMLFFGTYRIIDAMGNADFLLQKLGLSEGAARFLGSSRMIDVLLTLSLMAVAASLIYHVNRLMVAQATAAQGQPSSQEESATVLSTNIEIDKAVASDDRVIIDTPLEYLTSFFKEHTEAQAKRLLNPYLGKWVTTSGKVLEVEENRQEVTIYIDNASGVTSASFRAPHQAERAAVLRLNGEVKIFGQIDSGTRAGIHLDNCEIIASRPPA